MNSFKIKIDADGFEGDGLFLEPSGQWIEVKNDFEIIIKWSSDVMPSVTVFYNKKGLNIGIPVECDFEIVPWDVY